MSFDLLKVELASVAWDELEADGRSVDDLPGLLRQLAEVRRESVAERLTRAIENQLSGQVQQYAPAPFAVFPLLAILATSPESVARRSVLDILVDLGNARPRESNVQLFERANECRARVKTGCLQYYKALTDEDPTVRDSALWMIHIYDDHRVRVREALNAIAEDDEDERVRRAATRILTDAPFEFSWQTAEIEKRIAAEDQAV